MDSSIKTSVDGDDLIAIPLKILWYARLHPLLNSWRSTLHNTTNLILFSLFLALAIIGIINSYKENIYFTAECLETSLLAIQTIGKILTLYVHKEILLQLVIQRSTFWKPIAFAKQVQQECSVIRKRVKKILRCYYILGFVSPITYDLQPILAGTLPLTFYRPPVSFKYLVVMIWYLSFFTTATFIGTDSLFYSLVASLCLQFKLLKYKLKENVASSEESDNKFWKKVKEVVDHHVFLLSYCQKLNTAFQSVFLMQFLLLVANGAVAMFIFMEPGILSNRIKCFAHFVRTLCDAAFYCVSVEFLTDSVCSIKYQGKLVQFFFVGKSN
ncbi:hypothetical protein Zmor_000668 [Zophobas morio]|uniref:Odorant receptor n=1 Tax=Zophobas morio TaxID=2755281 RepID=A0AA38J379_9CUCU|nr:hypothetical protein Zmor_000668 [Zophobas morio]